MPLPVIFGNSLTNTLSSLDTNFAAVGQMGVLPCTITGTNAITLTPNANTPTVGSYSNYQCFSGIIANTNTGATTAQVGALAAKKVYLDAQGGPVQASGGELVAQNYAIFAYDSALDSGNGGFHVIGQLPASEILDQITTSQGAILYRGVSVWTGLQPGTSLQMLLSGTTPSWASLSSLLDSAVGTSVGSLIMRGASTWGMLQPGASGTHLTSQGAGSVLIWS